MVEIGFLRIVFLAVVVISVLLRFADLFLSKSPWLGILFLVFLIPLSFNKKEKDFFQSLDLNPFKTRLYRNLIFSIPLFIVFALSSNIQALIIGIFSILILAFDFSKVLSSKGSKSWININFQLLPWSVGIRDSLPLLILFALVSISGYFHVGLIFVGVFGFHFVILNFLRFNEDQNLIESYQLKARAFLNFYTRKFILYYLICQLPILIYTFILYPMIGLIHLAILILLVIHIFISVQLKFSSYKPGDSNDGAQMIQTMSFFFLLIPFTMPVSFWYAFRYHNLALKNLKVYLAC